MRRGISLEMRNHYRQELLKVDRAALIRVARSYLRDGATAVAVLAGEAALQRANETFIDQPLLIRRI
jgi:Zn-dependent M16 (insulinase) family peptidase